MEKKKPKSTEIDNKPILTQTEAAKSPSKKVKEIGGVEGLEPTRYGDWENNGRCTDF